jgi:hypothetical protein
MIRPANPGEVANPDDAYFGGCHTPPYPPPIKFRPWTMQADLWMILQRIYVAIMSVDAFFEN